MGRVGTGLEQEGIHPEQRRHQQHATVALLDVSRVDDGLHQQALHIDEDMLLLALDLFVATQARQIDPKPASSAILPLWLSMTAAAGLLGCHGPGRRAVPTEVQGQAVG